MKKLPKEFKEKWVAALRSGDYKQGMSNMYNPKDNSYCCLGVAGLVCGISKDTMAYNPFFNVHEARELGYPSELADYHFRHPLICMNDDGFETGANASFYEIADYIEKEL